MKQKLIEGKDKNVYRKLNEIDYGAQASVYKYLRLNDLNEFAIKRYKRNN